MKSSILNRKSFAGFAILLTVLISFAASSATNPKSENAAKAKRLTNDALFVQWDISCEDFQPVSHYYWSMPTDQLYFDGCLDTGTYLYQDSLMSIPASSGTYYIYGPDDGCNGPNFHRLVIAPGGEVISFELCF